MHDYSNPFMGKKKTLNCFHTKLSIGGAIVSKLDVTRLFMIQNLTIEMPQWQILVNMAGIARQTFRDADISEQAASRKNAQNIAMG